MRDNMIDSSNGEAVMHSPLKNNILNIIFDVLYFPYIRWMLRNGWPKS